MHFIEIAQAGVISNAPRITDVGMNVVSFVLSLGGMLAMISLVGGGIFYIFSSGNEESVSQAKRIIIYSVVGLAAIAMALLVLKTIGKFFD